MESIISLFGKPLERHQTDSGLWLARLSTVRGDYERAPDLNATLDYAHVLANGQRIHEAILVLSRGIKRYASDYKLYRQRGHWYISARQFDKAIADFESALRLISTMPPSESTPQSTDLCDLWYHLGIAWFLKGNFDFAASALGESLKHSGTDESTIACMNWYYRSLRRDRRNTEAALLLERFDLSMDAGDSKAHFRELALHSGELNEQSIDAWLEDESDEGEFTTLGFGIGHRLLLAGQTEQATLYFTKVIENRAWTAFGYVAAEVELHRSSLI